MRGDAGSDLDHQVTVMWQRIPWVAYLTDRHLVAVTIARMVALALLVAAPFAISVPGSYEAVPLLALWPALNATMVAMSLPERMDWLYRGESPRYRRLRLIAILVVEPILTGATWAAATTTDHGVAILSVALIAEGAVFFIAATQPWLAWVPAMLIGVSVIVLPWPFIELTPGYMLLLPAAVAIAITGIAINVFSASRARRKL